jgi:AcrR family transcriptional regulator
MNRPRTRDTDPGAVDGRLRLLDAAERLFDKEGLDGPSARGIAAAAGHRNTAAVWYHFGDRTGLVTTMAGRWAALLDDRRNALLDDLDANPDATARDYVRETLRPWVEALDSPDGRRRARLVAQLTHHPVYSTLNDLSFAVSTARGVARATSLAEHLTPERRAHRAQTVILAITSMLSMQSTLLDEDPPRRVPLPADVFLEEITDVVIAIVGAAG